MTSTALVPIGDMERMAQAFAKGGLFGTKTPEQCLSLLLLAQAEGQHPALAMRDFDVIQGKPAKKSEAMLRSFIAAGGFVEWHAMTDDKADASFMHPQGSNGKWVRIDWDLARATKAGLAGKDNWKKFSRQMLANRVISEGCRRVYPAATSGMYEPGEVRAMDREEKAVGKGRVDADGVIHDEDVTQGLDSNPPAPQQPLGSTPSPAQPAAPAGGPPAKTRSDTLLELCTQTGTVYATILRTANVKHADELSEDDYQSAVRFLNRKLSSLASAAHP